MALDQKDPFKELQFNGQPSEYRNFRRKTILAVAGLEDRHAYLAGPRLLARLTGEAWRATEHLNVGQLRVPDGWLTGIKALDDHYRYLPETELHEAIEEFLFLLKRRPNEGATSFSSRFRTQLDRVQSLIAQEREMTRKKRRKKTKKGSPVPSQHEAASSLEETDQEVQEHPEVPQEDSEPEEPFDLFGEQPDTGSEPARSDPRQPGRAATEPVRSRPPSTLGEDRGPPKKRAWKAASRGTFEQDHAQSQRKMQQMLGTLEIGHLKPTPIFPQSVLGHLYMRKFGLSREQRSQIIRATNGSSRFIDVEKIMKASDLEERRSDHKPAKPARRDTYAVQAHQQEALVADDDESSDLVDELDGSDSSSHELLEAEGPDEDSLHKKSKEKFKKAFKSYKDTKKRVKEIKKSRQSYYPVVALNQPAADATSSGTSAQVPLKQPFRYDRKSSGKGAGKKKSDSSGSRPKREEANLTEVSTLTSFNYMVEDDDTSIVCEEILLASIPSGYAIIDTGCTTSVIGKEYADKLIEFLREHHLPEPVPKALPPVKLKGFSGEATVSTEGLVWHVQLGKLWGTISTYVIPGKTAFLLSRPVLEGMDANVHVGRKTLTSEKHGMHQVQLRQASNGHLLMPLWNLPQEWKPLEVNFEEVAADDDESPVATHEPNDDEPPAIPSPASSPSSSQDCAETKPGEVRTKRKVMFKTDEKQGVTQNDQRSALQHIAKNTKKGQVDVKAMKDSLQRIFGDCVDEIAHAYVAYRPRLERIPYSAASESWSSSIVTLSEKGEFHVSPWAIREPCAERRGVHQTNLALFAYRKSVTDHVPDPEEHLCWCCNCCDSEGVENNPQSHDVDIEVLYEDVDWLEPDASKLDNRSKDVIKTCIQSIKKTSAQMSLSRLLSEPDAVERDLKQWLGPQSHKLNSTVELVEVFTDHAPLSAMIERWTGNQAIRIGKNHGQDLTKARDRQLLLCLIAWTRPKHVWYSWPCSDWGPWSRFNMARSPELKDEIMTRRSQHRRYLHTVAEAWNLQNLLKGFNHCENPLSSDAWKEVRLGDVYDVRFDHNVLWG